MVSSANLPPPDDPVERAQRISNLLVSQVRRRIGKANESIADAPDREFLNEGIALGDVEVSIERLELNMLIRSRLKLELLLPCLKDEDGIVPIDILELLSSNSLRYDMTSLPRFLSWGFPDFFFERGPIEAWNSEFSIELVRFSDVLDAVESRLTSFLTNRLGEDLDTDPDIGGNVPSDSGGSGGLNFDSAKLTEYTEVGELDGEEAEPQDNSVARFDARSRFALTPHRPAPSRSVQRVLHQRGTVGAAAAGFTTIPKLRQFTIHTAQPGLRVHYTPAYFINWSNVFGSPTSPVAGWLQAGRYKFGGMDANGNFKFDNANFDAPPLTSAQLVLK